jgi:hypothetical protein
MSIDPVVPEFPGLSGANWIAVEHAELVVTLYAAVTTLHENGLYRDACAARAVSRNGFRDGPSSTTYQHG